MDKIDQAMVGGFVFGYLVGALLTVAALFYIGGGEIVSPRQIAKKEIWAEQTSDGKSYWVKGK